MDIERELDRTKTAAFIGKNAAFYGSLLCNLDFEWCRDTPTASIDGIKIRWNPDWFLSLPAKTRQTVLIHELEHVARLHLHRIGKRDPRYWNYACDIRINNGLRQDGYSFDGTQPWIGEEYDRMGLIAEEDIYDYLVQNQVPLPGGPWTPQKSEGGDLIDADSPTGLQSTLNAVVQAIHQTKKSSTPGAIPGGVEELIERFLAPKVPWALLLQRFFTALADEDYSWRQPNRRYLHQDMYLPSLVQDEERLEHLIFYIDVSGSISLDEIVRENSEIKHVLETYRPQKLTVVQFDTKIQEVTEFTEHDRFDKIQITGRGGTCLKCVREHMRQHKPTAAIIFSDLHCTPMEPFTPTPPVIWIALNTHVTTVPFGQIIHINE